MHCHTTGNSREGMSRTRRGQQCQMQQLPLLLFTWPFFPGWPGNRPHQGQGGKHCPIQVVSCLGESSFPHSSATSATSCSRCPTAWVAAPQPQLSPVRAWSVGRGQPGLTSAERGPCQDERAASLCLSSQNHLYLARPRPTVPFLVG